MIFNEAVAALNSVDRGRLQELVDPQITFFPMRSAVQGAYIGHGGMNEFLDDNAQMYEYFRADFDRLESLPDGRLLAVGRISIKGRGGEIATEVLTAGIATFRDGRMLSWHDYGSEPAAREKL